MFSIIALIIELIFKIFIYLLSKIKLEVIIAGLAFIVSFVTLINTLRESKKSAFERKIDMEANYYSYPIMKNNSNCVVKIPEKICVISGNIENHNILIEEKHCMVDDYSIDIEFDYKNLTNIHPNSVYVKKLILFYRNENKNGNATFKKCLFFKSIDEQFKPTYIDGDGILHFMIKCIISKEIKEEILENFKNDKKIQMSFTVSFKNAFDVVSEYKYNILLTKENVKKVRNKGILGSDNNIFILKNNKVQSRNIKIKYIK